MEEFASFISEWGYWAVFLGSLIEGESIILTAGFLASQGYLSLINIMIIAFLGTLVADQALYYVGRLWGMKILDIFPRLKIPADRAFKLLHRYDTIFILSFRFIYGIRIISPVVIGTSGVTPQRFSLLNIPAALIWSVLSCGAGYYFGDFLMNQLTFTQRILVIMGVMGMCLFWIFWKTRKLFLQESENPPSPKSLDVANGTE